MTYNIQKYINRFNLRLFTIQKTSINDDITEIMKWIKKTRSQSESELINYFYTNPQFCEIYIKRTLTLNFNKALQLEMKASLDTPILKLTRDFNDYQINCLTPRESDSLIKRCCKFQNINIKFFLKNILSVIDPMQKKKKNTLYLHEEPNSGSTYIARSLQKAEFFYGEVNQGTASYTFMWQVCINKRLIALNNLTFTRP